MFQNILFKYFTSKTFPSRCLRTMWYLHKETKYGSKPGEGLQKVVLGAFHLCGASAEFASQTGIKMA